MGRFFLILSIAMALPLQAAPPLPPETPPAIREGLATLKTYSEEVERRVGVVNARPAPATVAPPAYPRPAPPPRGGRPSQYTSPETFGRDPFLVSPVLRGGSPRVSRRSVSRGATLSGTPRPELRLVALVRGPLRTLARIDLGEGEPVTVVAGDIISLPGGDAGYRVLIGPNGLTLKSMNSDETIPVR
ncbi:MAG TPA: hypothetical protein PKH69_05475 [Thiobacillaceae bacterium]|nr:hypothetical protein [Thiobacillaceae bacterium]HNU64157.1 hypothetical protein [Thiobacillaceae bacterium]